MECGFDRERKERGRTFFLLYLKNNLIGKCCEPPELKHISIYSDLSDAFTFLSLVKVCIKRERERKDSPSPCF